MASCCMKFQQELNPTVWCSSHLFSCFVVHFSNNTTILCMNMHMRNSGVLVNVWPLDF